MALSCSHSIASEESFLNSVLYFSICERQLLMRLFRITRFNTQQVLRRCEDITTARITTVIIIIFFLLFILEWKILFYFIFFNFFFFIFKLYIFVLVLPNIKMNPPRVYMCSPSRTLLPPPSPYHPSGPS